MAGESDHLNAHNEHEPFANGKEFDDRGRATWQGNGELKPKPIDPRATEMQGSPKPIDPRATDVRGPSIMPR